MGGLAGTNPPMRALCGGVRVNHATQNAAQEKRRSLSRLDEGEPAVKQGKDSRLVLKLNQLIDRWVFGLMLDSECGLVFLAAFKQNTQPFAGSDCLAFIGDFGFKRRFPALFNGVPGQCQNFRFDHHGSVLSSFLWRYW